MTGELEIISLGGCGGFGLNATLFVSGDEGILVDFGSGFPHGAAVGVTRLVPDASAVVDRCHLRAIVLTHAHDDHAAGLPHLPVPWRRAPVYGTSLTLAFVADRFEDQSLPQPELRTLVAGERVEISPAFAVTPIAVTHSIPDSVMLAIQTPAGLVVHSGDFRFDDAPLCGPLTDWAALERLGREGVDLLLCDSTGALRDEPTRSETAVAAELLAAIKGRRGQVVVSTFASQLHRLQAVIALAPQVRRKVGCLSMRMARTIRHGVSRRLFSLPAGVLLETDDLFDLPDDQRIWLAGGCQGEPESSLARLSYDQHPRCEVGRGDTLVVTASVIPGSEIPYGLMIDRFLRMEVDVVDTLDHPGIHASGHGSRAEIARLIEILQPRAFIPIHGSRRHLEACLDLARRTAKNLEDTALVEMGGRVRLDSGGLRLLPPLEFFPLSLDDAGRLVSRETVLARRRLAESGIAIIVIHESGAEDEIRVRGVGVTELDGDPSLAREVQKAVDIELGARATEPLDERITRRVGNLLRGGLRRRPPVIVVKRGDDA